MRHNLNKGFSLIEVVVSISIVTFALFSMLVLLPFSLRVNRSSANLTQATYLAQAAIENSLSISYENLNAGTIESKAKLSADASNFLYNFERETTVAYVDANLNNSVSDIGLKKVSTTVYWQDPADETEKTYTLTTLISQK